MPKRRRMHSGPRSTASLTVDQLEDRCVPSAVSDVVGGANVVSAVRNAVPMVVGELHDASRALNVSAARPAAELVGDRSETNHGHSESGHVKVGSKGSADDIPSVDSVKQLAQASVTVAPRAATLRVADNSSPTPSVGSGLNLDASLSDTAGNPTSTATASDAPVGALGAAAAKTTSVLNAGSARTSANNGETTSPVSPRTQEVSAASQGMPGFAGQASLGDAGQGLAAATVMAHVGGAFERGTALQNMVGVAAIARAESTAPQGVPAAGRFMIVEAPGPESAHVVLGTDTPGFESALPLFVREMLVDLPTELPDFAGVTRVFDQVADFAGLDAAQGGGRWLLAAALVAAAAEVGRRQVQAATATATWAEAPPPGWLPDRDGSLGDSRDA